MLPIAVKVLCDSLGANFYELFSQRSAKKTPVNSSIPESSRRQAFKVEDIIPASLRSNHLLRVSKLRKNGPIGLHRHGI